MNFPAILPAPSRNYNSSVDPRLAVTEFESGFRQRQKFSSVDEYISVSWEFQQLEFDAFCYFVKNILVYGSLPFDISILGLDGLEARTVHLLGGKFSWKYSGFMQYVVSATLISPAPDSMPGEIYEFLLTDEGLNPEEFVSLSEIIYLYLHVFYGDSSPSDEITDFLSSH